MQKQIATKEQIDSFFEGIKEIPCKNWGGCLVFCYVFYLWLLKHGYNTSSFQIVQYDSWSNNIPKNQAFIRGETNEAVSSSHFSWIYNGVEYDSDGICTWNRGAKAILNGLNTKYGDLVDSFCVTALTQGDWNTDFDRKDAAKVVKENLGIDLILIL